MSNHTPTPQLGKVEESPYKVGLIGINFAEPIQTENICQVFGHGTKQIAERSAFIVRACNSHDKLVNALKAAKEMLEIIGKENKELYAPLTIDIANKALSEAQLLLTLK